VRLQQQQQQPSISCLTLVTHFAWHKCTRWPAYALACKLPHCMHATKP
jgi:hypothetical protein